MRKILFWGGQVDFIAPALLALPPDRLTIYTYLEHTSAHNLEAFKSKGYDVRPTCPVEDLYGQFVITDAYNVYHGILDDAVAHKAQVLTYRHATDGYGVRTHKACWNILAHQHLSLPHPPMPGTFTREEADWDPAILRTVPPLCKEEFSYSGPYHMGEWESKRHTDKHILRQKLEEALECALPRDKPVVAFFKGEICHDAQLVNGLRSLAAHATIIYKAFARDDSVLEAVRDVVIPWKTTAYAQNILRFSVDWTLANFYSGTFATSLMLGLPVVPYHTRIVLYDGKKRSHKTVNATLQRVRYDACRDAMRVLQHSYDIQDSRSIAAAINSPEYYDQYYQQLPAVQAAAFGDYVIEGAAQKTAMLIMLAFSQGTFGKYAEAVHFRNL